MNNAHQPDRLVELHDVSRLYVRGSEQVHALDRVSLTVEPGQFILIKGKSGSGKTTMLNLIGGLERPSSGQILYQGRNIEGYSEKQLTKWRRAELGFVFQAFALFPTLTACENAELPLRIGGSPPKVARERALHYLDRVGLAKRAHHRIDELSGGEQQRVAVARSLVNDPKLILADEPTGELDLAMRYHIMELLQQVVEEQGITMCMTSHDPMVTEFVHLVHTLQDGKLMSTEHVRV